MRIVFLFLASAVYLTLAILKVSAEEAPCTGSTGLVSYASPGRVVMSQPVPLDAGHYDCVVAADASASSQTTIQALLVGLSPTAATLSDFPWTATSGQAGGPRFGISVATQPIRIDLATPRNYFVNVQSYFGTGFIFIRTYYHCAKANLTTDTPRLAPAPPPAP